MCLLLLRSGGLLRPGGWVCVPQQMSMSLGGGPGCRGWGSPGQPRGVKHAGGRSCPGSSTDQPPLFWLLLPVSPLPSASPGHGPCSVALGSGLGAGEGSRPHGGPKASCWRLRRKPSPCTFPESFAQTLFLTALARVERCLLSVLLLVFYGQLLGLHS